MPLRAPTLKAWLPACSADGMWNLLKWDPEVDIFGSMNYLFERGLVNPVPDASLFYSLAMRKTELLSPLYAASPKIWKLLGQGIINYILQNCEPR